MSGATKRAAGLSRTKAPKFASISPIVLELDLDLLPLSDSGDLLRFSVPKVGLVSTTQAFLAHFRKKLFLAAPESFLPSALTAFGKHASRLHFLRKLLSAAPASGLPFLPTALLAHVSWVIAGPIAKAIIMTAKRIRFMACSPTGK
jgi:hypothetical protein